jgi:uncharacterized SAM-binding protein YcdF (DUF218 family)
MKKWVGIVLGLVLALILLFLFKAQVLRLAALPLVSSDNGHLQKADAILILGGAQDARSLGAIALYRGRAAPVILLANEQPLPIAEIGMDRTGTEVALEVLANFYRVPPQDIVVIGTSSNISYIDLLELQNSRGRQEFLCELDRVGYVSSTMEEAKALRLYAIASQARSVIIVTNPFHSRRVRRIFDKILGGAAQVQVSTINYPKFGPDNWWESEEGVIAFNNEWVKAVYYWMKY